MYLHPTIFALVTLVTAIIACDRSTGLAATPVQETYLGDPLLSHKDGVMRLILLPPKPGHPRNSEGDTIQLSDGRILLVYTHFVGGESHDHAGAYLAGRFSSDGGKTWNDQDTTILANEGKMNIMSVSLLRLADGRIALFYLVKNSETDCRPYMRISSDECRTWGDRTQIIDKVGYYVLNNDRVVQLENGRLVVPVAMHRTPDKPDWVNVIMCYLSDNNGKTWRRSKEQVLGTTPQGKGFCIQEPGIVPLKDGRLLLHCRTDRGCHYFSYSSDEAETWSELEPSTLEGPRTAAAIERIPTTGDLLCLWNVGPKDKQAQQMKYTIGLSSDEGNTWKNIYVLEGRGKPYNRYCCYCSILFVKDHVLLAHCNGHWGSNVHEALQITRFPIRWLYEHQLPNVLLIGDSISIGYTTEVRTNLAGEANVYRPPTNCSFTTKGVRELDQWLGSKRWDAIHFNFGLHDTSIKKDGKYRCPIDQYEKNLHQIVRRLKQTNAALIWATTTPIPQARTDNRQMLPRYDRDVVNYNGAAQTIMEANDVIINDLYAVTKPQLDKIQKPADIHFSSQGYRVLAENVAGAIRKSLTQRIKSANDDQ